MKSTKTPTGHDKDPDDNGKICQEATHPLREETSSLELLQAVGDDEDSKEEDDGHEEDVVAVSTPGPNHFPTSFATKDLFEACFVKSFLSLTQEVLCNCLKSPKSKTSSAMKYTLRIVFHTN